MLKTRNGSKFNENGGSILLDNLEYGGDVVEN
jgi:hypothetical protein